VRRRRRRHSAKVPEQPLLGNALGHPRHGAILNPPRPALWRFVGRSSCALTFFGRAHHATKPAAQSPDPPGGLGLDRLLACDWLLAIQLIPIGADRDHEDILV
jgi:hypothetical protein